VNRLVLLVVAGCLACASCIRPSTHNAGAELRTTAANLGKIRSGNLDVVMQTAAEGHKPSGFGIKGKFSFDSSGTLPLLDVTVDRFDEARHQTTHLVSTGTQVFVDESGKMQPVPAASLDGLRGLGSRSGSSGPLGRFPIDNWISGNPVVTAGGLVGTVDTDKTTAQLDVGQVMNGLISLAHEFGSSAASQLTQLSAPERERVRRSVRSATLEVWSGRKDKIMRRLVMDLVFATKNTQLAKKLRALSGITIHFEAKITDLNKPVAVPSP
jgi:hypothetical protein